MATQTTNLEKIPVSGLTVKDIENYINDLAKKAGYMSQDEIKKYVDDIAKKAGVMTQEELRNLINQLVSESGVLSPNEIKAFISKEVLAQISKLNENKDYINQIKVQLEQEISELELQVNSVREDNLKLSDKVNENFNAHQFEIGRLKDQIQILENVVKDVQQNKEVIDAISREREARVDLDFRLNQKIDTVNKTLSSEINKKIDTEKTLTYLDNLENEIKYYYDPKISILNNNLKVLKNTITDNQNKIDTLLLNSDDLIKKINILKDLTGSSDKVLTGFENNINDLRNEILTAKNLISKLDNNINQKILEINTKVNEIKDKLYQETYTRDKQTAALKTEIQNNKAYIDTSIEKLEADFVAFQKDINTEIVSINDKLTDLSDQSIATQKTLLKQIKNEVDERVNANKALEIRFNKKIQDVASEVAKIDYSDDIKKLNDIISDLEKRAAELENISSKAIVDIKDEIHNIEALIDNNHKTAFAKILSEEQSRKADIAKLTAELQSEIKIRKNNIEIINKAIADLQTTLVSDSNSKDSEKSGEVSSEAIDQIKANINSLNKELLDNKNAVATLEGAIKNFEAELKANASDAKRYTDLQFGTLKANLEKEVAVREADLGSLKIAATELLNKVSSIVNSVDISKVNLLSLQNAIENTTEKLKDDTNNMYNKLINITDALSTRIFNLEGLLTGTVNKLKEENSERLAADLDLANKIEEAKKLVNTEVSNALLKINEETQNRVKADNDINLKISTEVTKFENLYNSLNTKLDKEISDIEATVKDNTDFIKKTSDEVQNRVDEINNTVNKEIQDRVKADVEILNKLKEEVNNRIENVKTLTEEINKEKDRIDAILKGTSTDLDSFKEITEYVNKLKDSEDDVITGITKDISEAKKEFTNKINQEIQDRAEADNKIQELINKEVDIRTKNDQKILEDLNQEIQDRSDAINALHDNVINIKKELVKEIQNTNTALQNLTNFVNKVETDYKNADKALKENIDKNLKDVTDRITEVTKDLKNDIQNVIKITDDIKEDIHTKYTELSTKINLNKDNFANFLAGVPAEKQSLKAVYNNIDNVNNTLSQNINDLDKKLSTELKNTNAQLNQEIQKRAEDISEVNTQINKEIQIRSKEISDLTSKLSDEISDRKAIENDLKTEINKEIQARTNQVQNLENKISAEVSDRKNEIAQVKTDLTNAINEYRTADTNLKTSIDNLDKSVNTKIEVINNDLKNTKTQFSSELADVNNKLMDEVNRSVKMDNELLSLANSNKTRIDLILQDADDKANSFKELDDKIDRTRTTLSHTINENYNTLNDAINKVNGDLINESTNRKNNEAELNKTISIEIQDRKNDTKALNDKIDSVSKNQNTQDQAIKALINDEVNHRIEADKILNDRINQEIQNRSNADNVILSKLDIEANTRATKDQDLQDQINKKQDQIVAIDTKLDKEIAERKTADTKIELEVDAIKKNLDKILEGTSKDLDSFKEIVDLINSIDLENDKTLGNFAKTTKASIDALNTRLEAESDTRINQDRILRNSINNEVQDRKEAIVEVLEKLNQEIQDRKAEDNVTKEDLVKLLNSTKKDLNSILTSHDTRISNHDSDIKTLSDKLSDETKNRIEADAKIENKISALENKNNIELSDIKTQIITEVKARKDDVEALKNALKEESETRRVKDITNADNLTNEITNRQNADKALNDKIDNESKARTIEDKNLRDLIINLRQEINNISDKDTQKIIDLDAKINSILDGSEIDLDYFKDIVDTINNIDSDNDIINQVRKDLNAKLEKHINESKKHFDNIDDKLKIIDNKIDNEISILDSKITTKVNSELTDLDTKYSKKIEDLNKETSNLENKLRIQDEQNIAEHKSLKEYIQNLVYNETQARLTGDNILNQNIIRESTARKVEINDLVTDINKKLSDENQERKAQDDVLNTKIDEEIKARLRDVQTLNETIDRKEAGVNTKLENLLKALNEEISRAKAAEGSLIYSDVLADDAGNKPTNNTDAINSVANQINNLELKLVLKIRDDLIQGKIPVPGLDKEALQQDMVAQLDQLLVARVNKEMLRAESAEEAIKDSLKRETQERAAGDKAIRDDLNAIVSNTNNRISDLSTQVIEEIARAKTAENNIKVNLEKLIQDLQSQNEKEEADINENRNDIIKLQDQVKEELINREKFQKTIVNYIDSSVNKEISRAEKAEDKLNTKIDSEAKTREENDNVLLDQINDLRNANKKLTDNLKKVNAELDNILKGSSLDLDSFKEIVDYINENDTEILTTISNTIKGAGLSTSGDYVANKNTKYIKKANSLNDADIKLDQAISSLEQREAEDIKAMIDLVNTEVQNRKAEDDHILEKLDLYYNENLKRIQDNAEHITTNAGLIKDLDNRLKAEVDTRFNEDQKLDKAIKITRENVGLLSDGSYHISGTNYLDETKTVIDALIELDHDIKNNENNIGDLNKLHTKTKDNLVNAINEVNDRFSFLGTENDFDDAFTQNASE